MNYHAKPKSRRWQFGTGALVSFVTHGPPVFVALLHCREHIQQRPTLFIDFGNMVTTSGECYSHNTTKLVIFSPVSNVTDVYISLYK